MGRRSEGKRPSGGVRGEDTAHERGECARDIDSLKNQIGGAVRQNAVEVWLAASLRTLLGKLSSVNALNSGRHCRIEPSLHPLYHPQHDADVAGGRPAAVLLLKPVEGEAERRRIGDRSAREADERADLPRVIGIDELAAAVAT